MAWDAHVDLVVAGSGAAGLTAALVAASEGLDVLLCEKSARLGGTTATSGGGVWIPMSQQALAAGVSDSLDQARLYLRSELGEFYREAMVDAFLESGPEALDYIACNGDVRFELADIPDYHPNLPGGASTGRTLMSIPFDGRRLGPAFDEIQPPMRRMMVLGGMMFSRKDVATLLRPLSSWTSFRTSAGLLLRYFFDRLRYRRGTRLLIGNALIAQLVYALQQKGVPRWTASPVVDLAMEKGRVAGAVIQRQGKRVHIGARRGVVLATGGAARNFETLEKIAPEFPHALTLAHQDDTGDGLAIATKYGAAIDDRVHSPAVWTPASVFQEVDGTQSVMTYGYLDRGKPGAIIVNARGERFVNEANSYHDVVMAMYARRETDRLIAFLICDRDFIHDYGLGVIPPLRGDVSLYVRQGYVKMAQSLEELAYRIEIDPAGLARTVGAHNAYAVDGHDLAFGKGSTAFNRYNGDPKVKPNPCLRPLQRAPFFALRVHAATLGVSIGLKTDENAGVLDTNGRRLHGLWAVGNEQASVMAGCCPAAGTTLGPGIAFGYRAAMDAAKGEPA